MTAADLAGRFLLDASGTVWADGPLTTAVRHGAICYLDEIVEARQDTTVIIHPLADNRRVRPLDRNRELVPRRRRLRLPPLSETATRLVTDLDLDLDLVHRLVRDRAALRPSFAIAWRKISRADPAVQHAWAAATLELSRVHAGIPPWRRSGASARPILSRAWPPPTSAVTPALGLYSPAYRRCPPPRASSAPPALPSGGRPWPASHAKPRTWSPRRRPPDLSPRQGYAAAFVDFVAAGLNATATDKRRRITFVTGSDPLAGEPSDIDVANPAELVEDARCAILDLRQRGIEVYGIVMDPMDAGSGPTIFGRHNTMLVRRLDDLPARLTGMYFPLAQR